MLKEVCVCVMSRVEAVFARLATQPAWLARGVFLAILISLFISFPRISFFLGNDSQIVNFWPMIEARANDPLFTSVQQYENPGIRGSKFAFRVVLPATAKVLHVDWRGVLVFQFCLGVAILFLVGKIAMDLFADRVAALATVFGVSSIYAGKAAFLQIGGMGDAFAFALLTIAAAFRPPLIIAAAIFLACFTDERAVVVAPLVALYWVIRNETNDTPKWINLQSIAVVAALVAACTVRFTLMYKYKLYIPFGPTEVGTEIMRYTLPTLQFELPHVLAGLWLWPLAAGILLWRAKWWFSLVALMGGTAAIVGASVLVFDVDRSLAYSLPVLFVAMAVAASRRMTIADVRSIAIAGFVISFLFPVNNLLGGVTNRYSDGNPMPIELVRFYLYSTRP